MTGKFILTYREKRGRENGEKRRKIEKGKVENWKCKEKKFKKSGNQERPFFFFFFLFFFLFFFCFSLLKTTEICSGSTKMEIFYREKWLCPLRLHYTVEANLFFTSHHNNGFSSCLVDVTLWYDSTCGLAKKCRRLMITRPSMLWVRAPLRPACLCPWARYIISICFVGQSASGDLLLVVGNLFNGKLLITVMPPGYGTVRLVRFHIFNI